MQRSQPTRFPQADLQIIRDLARRVKEAAADPRMAERRRAWTQHNMLRPGRPIVWLSPEGAWRELLPDATLRCQDREARGMEWALRERLYRHAHFDDDSVIEARWEVPKAIGDTGWGLQAEWTYSEEALGARQFKPVLHTPADLKKLQKPRLTQDEADSARRLAQAQEVLGDILDVVQVGRTHISFHLLNQYSAWRGLEETMTDMIAEPHMLHDAMAILAEGHADLIQQLEREHLLSLNNNDSYHSSGGKGWSDELPAAGFDGRHARRCDLWASAESQELAQVSPAMHREFALPYESRLLAPFGLTGYGCCEDLTLKLDDVLTLPHIRRLSISPWADVEACAAKLGDRFIFSWKPHPAHLVGHFDARALRAYIGHTVRVCRAAGCRLEMILKDTHTCENHPARFDQWAQIARAAVAEEWR